MGKLKKLNDHVFVDTVDHVSKLSGKMVALLSKDSNGKNPMLKPRRLFPSEARTLLVSRGRYELNRIDIISKAPFINQDGSIVKSGYNKEHNVYVTGGSADEVPFDEAVAAIKELLVDLVPYQPADLSRGCSDVPDSCLQTCWTDYRTYAFASSGGCRQPIRKRNIC